ncbi:MAG: serine protease [Alteromonadaceae bacterium]|jgi:serine protease
MKTLKISKVCAAVACTLALSTAAMAASQDSNQLKSATAATDSVRYIVTFKNDSHNAVSKTGQSVFNAASARSAIQSKGAKIKRELSKHRAIAAELSPQAAKALRNDPSVASMEVDQKRYASSLYNNTAGNPNDVQVTPYAIIQSQADQLALQSGQKVCVIDSGLDASNPDFDRSVITGSNDSGTGNWDLNGGPHGTHVAGTVGAVDNGVGVVGMAPGVPMHIVKVFNAAGWGYSSDLAAAADRCTEAGATIITMSLGGGGSNSTEENAFNAFTNNGGLVLAAAGNDGNNVRSFPAGYKSVMMIGANDGDNNIADFSQFPSCTNGGQTDDGYCVEVTAGGVNTLSTYPSQSALDAAGASGEGTGWTTGTVDGVSMTVTGMENLGSVSGSVFFMGTAEATNSGANGKVCIIDRGAISFHDKVKACQDSGGIGAVIVNNEAGVLSGTLGETNATTIPAMGAALEDRSTWMNASTVGINIESSMYGLMSGTSMATPGVAGIAALVWSNHSTCTGTEIRNALKATAADAGSAGKDVYFGHGVVKAKTASDYITANGCEGNGGGTTPPTEPPVGDTVLANGTAKTDLTSTTELMFTMEVPAGASDINFAMNGGTGDADMYVRLGSAPTDSAYDCRPYKSGNAESCTGTTGGTYYVRIKAYSAFGGVSLTGSYSETTPPTPGTGIDSTITNINIARRDWAHYTVEADAAYSSLTFTITGGTGDADLYVRQGAQATTSTYDCRPYKTGNDEVCTINNPAQGTWHIDIRGYSAVTGLTLTAKSVD